MHAMRLVTRNSFGVIVFLSGTAVLGGLNGCRRGETDAPTIPTKYLTFQVMVGTPGTEYPPPLLVPEASPPITQPLVKTPEESVAKVVDYIIQTVGLTGSKKAKLGFVVGPLSFDLTDDEIASTVHESFAIARSRNVAVGFHIDDAMFWSKSSLYVDANKEWTSSFDGRNITTGLFMDWGSAASFPPRLCMNSPAVQAEVSRRARMVLGRAISAELDSLKAGGREELFAGVIVGWESHMGHDYDLDARGDGADPRVGFHALANAGFGPTRPPDFGVEIAKIVKAHIELWADGLLQAGVPRAKLYSHVNFLPKSGFLKAQQNGQIPASVTYTDLVNTAPSSIEPETAFGANFNPGFSMYPTHGTLDEIYEKLRAYGNPPWAQSEGTNAIPGLSGGPTVPGPTTMEIYLAQRFERGAMLVNMFSMGLGGDAQKDNPFRLATEDAEAVVAYRKFLSQ